MKYEIIQTKNGESKVIDHANDLQEAQYYASEYAKEDIKASVTYKLITD